MKKNHDLMAGLVIGVLLGIHYGGLIIPHMVFVYLVSGFFVLPIVISLVKKVLS